KCTDSQPHSNHHPLHDALPISAPASEAATTTQAVDKSYLSNIPALSNESGGCGFSAANGRDSKNVPNDMYWYVKKYGKYNADFLDRKSSRLNSSHVSISYAVFC